MEGTEISLTSRTPGVEIRYTRDGSEPTGFPAYREPFPIKERPSSKPAPTGLV